MEQKLKCVFCLQAPHICDAAAGLESCSFSEQHSTVEHDEQKLNSSYRNLFSSLQTTGVGGAVLSDIKCLLLPKSKHQHTTDSAEEVNTCGQEQINVGFRSSDNVQSIMVRLPLIARLRHIKCETPVPCIKMEIANADKDSCAEDKEDIKPPTAADVETTDEMQADVKKEATAAAKGLQLARETIANIFGTELQPPTMLKIPIKRRAEKDADERSDAKRSRTFSRSDDVHDRSFDRNHGRCVLDALCSDNNVVHFSICISEMWHYCAQAMNF